MDKTSRIIEETEDFAVVYKPPKMHSAPLNKSDQSKQKSEETLFDWFASRSSTKVELMHRLDFETHGLVLFAKNEKSFNFFNSLQDRGEFVKEYSAICSPSSPEKSEGFPPPPVFSSFDPSPETPLIIMSYFRPFGPGRKLVRPVIEEKKYLEIAKDNGGFYRTEIASKENDVFILRIKRGFRHQIRCHLCWIGFPILNDPLYANTDSAEGEFLALCAHALHFADPSNGQRREYRISPLEKAAFSGNN